MSYQQQHSAHPPSASFSASRHSHLAGAPPLVPSGASHHSHVAGAPAPAPPGVSYSHVAGAPPPATPGVTYSHVAGAPPPAPPGVPYSHHTHVPRSVEPPGQYTHVPQARPVHVDFSHMSTQELARRLQHAEYERMQALQEKSTISQVMNQKLQVVLGELRSVKETNQKLQLENQTVLSELRKHQDAYAKVQGESKGQLTELHKTEEKYQKLSKDSQELRDLCCYLDDDRQKCRKLAQEWQKFGHYIAALMKKEVAAYQGKLEGLDHQQQFILKENFELKELCLALDQEGKEVTNSEALERDQGDGSSNSSANDKHEEFSPQSSGASCSDVHTLEYIKSLETRVHMLENDRKVLENDRLGTPSTSAEAVTKAMKVLEIHEQLETPAGLQEDLDPIEKAVLRQMCNVVWKKLNEDLPQGSDQTV